MLPDLSPDEAKSTVEHIRKAVEADPFVCGVQKLKFTVSIGLTLNLGDTLTAMISEADEVLYQAKEGGRNRVIMAECQEVACSVPSV